MPPSQSNTLVQGIALAQKAGFTIEFLFLKDVIRSRTSGKTYSTTECFLVSYSRYEGMTDPGDASILFLIECADGEKGYISSPYGVYANAELMAFMRALEKKKST